jgi:hypothetical protein
MALTLSAAYSDLCLNSCTSPHNTCQKTTQVCACSDYYTGPDCASHAPEMTKNMDVTLNPLEEAVLWLDLQADMKVELSFSNGNQKPLDIYV